MAESRSPSSPSATAEKPASLKRKRSSTDEDTENMPPRKITSVYEEVVEEPAHNVIVESTSDSSDDESIDLGPMSNLTEVEYNSDFYNPPSLPELPNYVLSPLENVAEASTPHSTKRLRNDAIALAKRKCPLPALSWGDRDDVWDNLIRCDIEASRQKNPNMFDHHPQLQPRMRAILLDWLNEVCEVYKLQRETFYLAVDYIDRYLTSTIDVEKGRLQLIGITCLFIAAKVEEVYPPKLAEFAYVTDSACTVEEILLQELNILKVLKWDITPMTINGWLNIYIQVASVARNAKRRLIGESEVGTNAVRAYTFVFPQYSSLEYAVCAQLLDLALLHVDVTKHRASVVAAAALAHCYSRELAVRVSGYGWDALERCYRWLAACERALREAPGGVALKGAMAAGAAGAGDGGGAAALLLLCPDYNDDDGHRLQAHNVTLDMFDQVYKDQTDTEQTDDQQETEVVYLPTPPKSEEKSPQTEPTSPPEHT